MEYRVLNIGDRAITFEFGTDISRKVSHHVLGVHAQIKELIAQKMAGGLIESVPTFRSLTVHFDPLKLFPEEVETLISPYIKEGHAETMPSTHWSFPVCYDPEYAPDLDDVARATNLTTQEVIETHLKQFYDVFMLGFLPGFAFMGMLDDKLRLPRRDEPRTAVPQGSVAIADQLTAIYPSVSPGGWHLIGQTPVRLFDATENRSALLKAGDRVGFRRVNRNEFEKIRRTVDTGDYSYQRQCQIQEAA